MWKLFLEAHGIILPIEVHLPWRLNAIPVQFMWDGHHRHED